jgi:tetratricopeptide (TPR) repeat protein
MNLGKYNDALTAFDRATSITINNATTWNNKGLAYVQLGKPLDASECFKKALGIDPNFADAKKNRDSVSGQLQVVQIKGTITPVPTISRVGTFYTTATPVQQPTEVLTAVPVTPDVTPVAPVVTTPVKKTTYSPVSPVTAFGAVIVVSGIVCVLRQRK